MSLSVIIPIRMTGVRYERMLDTLRNQTLQDIQVVVVDSDGNPGAARNQGLANAQGDYVAFCDDDDWVEPEMYSELVAKADETGADLVWEDYFVDYGRRSIRIAQAGKETSDFLIESILGGQIRGFSWNKLFRRATLLKTGIRFPEDISYCEDIVFLCEYLSHGLRVAYLPSARYHYVQHRDSLSNRSFALRLNSALKVMSRLEKGVGRLHLSAFASFRAGVKYDAIMCPDISACTAFSVCPDIRRLPVTGYSMPQRLFFLLAMHGLRPVVCYLKKQKAMLIK